MAKRSTFSVLLRRTWLPALALVVMAFFGGYAVLGPNGVLAYGEYRHQLAAKKVTYEALDHLSEEHTSELQSLMRISYAVFCLQNKRHTLHENNNKQT